MAALAAAAVASVVAGALGGLLASGSPKPAILAGTAIATLAGGAAYLGVGARLADPRAALYRRARDRPDPASARDVSIETALADPSAWDAFVQAADPGSYLQLAPWAQVKRANGWTATRIGTDVPAGRCRAPAVPAAPGSGSLPRSSFGDPARCPGHSPTRRAAR